MSDDRQDFERFMKERAAAAGAYVRGDAAPLAQLTARVSPATFFGPRGGHTQGAPEVLATYQRDAQAFEPGGESAFEILQLAAGGGVAYWAGFQRATVRVRGKQDPVQMTLRVTELFRREGDAWKLVHRHADPLASKET